MKFNLWMFDSNDYPRDADGKFLSGYDYVHPDQIAWYEATAAKLREDKNNPTVRELRDVEITRTMTVEEFADMAEEQGAVGAELGANKLEQAKSTDDKLRFFSVASTLILALAIIPLAPLFPEVYKTSDEIKALSSYMIIVQAIAMPLWSYTHACYFTLRAGGQSFITFLFDSCYQWTLVVPLAFALSRYTDMPLVPMSIAIECMEIIKCILGYYLVKKRTWVKDLVNG